MYRSSRDTSQWFDNNRKGQMKDLKHNIALSPGMYNPVDQPLGDKRKTISWNYG